MGGGLAVARALAGRLAAGARGLAQRGLDAARRIGSSMKAGTDTPVPRTTPASPRGSGGTLGRTIGVGVVGAAGGAATVAAAGGELDEAVEAAAGGVSDVLDRTIILVLIAGGFFVFSRLSN